MPRARQHADAVPGTCLNCSFTGTAICAIARCQQGSSQMLAGGVLAVLADLPSLPRYSDGAAESDPAAASAESLLIGEADNAGRTVKTARRSPNIWCLAMQAYRYLTAELAFVRRTLRGLMENVATHVRPQQCRIMQCVICEIEESMPPIFSPL